MADRPQLRSPLLHVVMDDGGEWDVQTGNRDLLRWDETAAMHKWGSAQDMPIKWQTFIAWAASKREKATDLSWDEFKEQAAGIWIVEPLEPVDPTIPALGGD